jgi:hypothetical protein
MSPLLNSQPSGAPCVACGQLLSPGFAFCASCGAKCQPAAAGLTPAAAAAAPPPTSKAGGSRAFGLAVGPTATKELVRFVGCFSPLGNDQSPAAHPLRDAAFKAADPNGNGHCSLAELETWVLQVLVAKYPRVGKGAEMKEPGKDLFDAFRPSYIRAFSDAKDYKADDGAKIKGTKNATADAFVQRDEFRLFCCYLCIYATMFDAFSRLDGGSKGRDHRDDLRLEQAEFEVRVCGKNASVSFRKACVFFAGSSPSVSELHLSFTLCAHARPFIFLHTSPRRQAGWKHVNEYGFVCLQSVSGKGDARKLFEAMDGNGGGVVLLDEFCKYLKACEVDAYNR